MDEYCRQRLARLIKDARGNDTQRGFAKKLGVSYTSLQSWEGGSSFPEFEKLEIIADFLGIQVSEVVRVILGEDENHGFQTVPKSAEELFTVTQMLSPSEQIKLIKLIIDARFQN